MMRSGEQRWGARRIALGVCLLYALVLQALLGGVVATRMAVQAPGVICISHAGDPEGEQDGSAHDESCCAAACRVMRAGLSAPAPLTLPPPRPALTREARWRAIRVTGPPARSLTSAHPRAPPAVA